MIRPEALRLMHQTAASFEELGQELYELAGQFELNPRYSANDKLFSLVRSAEQNTLKLRSAARAAHRDLSPAVYEDLSSEICVSVEERKRWVEITVPAILPGRSRRDNTLFITRPLRSALVRFRKAKGLPRLHDCVICIEHQYDEALSTMRIRDYDSIETKRYLDVIESLLLTDGSGLYCSVFQTTKLSDRDCTKFYLMSPEALPEWLLISGKLSPGTR